MKHFLFITLCFFCSTSIAQLSVVEAKQLSSDASFLKKHNPEDYTGFKDFAVKKWGDDYEMIVEEINEQIEAFIAVFSDPYDSHDNLRQDALYKWGLQIGESKLAGNPEIDWVMVQNEMDQHLELTSSIDSTDSPGQLSGRSERYKKEMPKVYNSIKSFAIHQWGDDHTMVVFEINHQIDSFAKVSHFMLTEAKGNEVYKKIFHKAIRKWSNGNVNSELLENNTINWRMVEREIETQLTSLNSYQAD